MHDRLLLAGNMVASDTWSRNDVGCASHCLNAAVCWLDREARFPDAVNLAVEFADVVNRSVGQCVEEPAQRFLFCLQSPSRRFKFSCDMLKKVTCWPPPHRDRYSEQSTVRHLRTMQRSPLQLYFQKARSEAPRQQWARECLRLLVLCL